MGARPTWDPSPGGVTGIEVLRPAAMGRPRVDVTWRISGLFRDIFPAQIALIDAAVRAIAAREETSDENPQASARRALPVPSAHAWPGRDGPPPPIFATSPTPPAPRLHHLPSPAPTPPPPH